MEVVQIRGILLLQRIAVSAALFISSLALSGCRKTAEPPPIIPNQELQAALLSQYPMAVSVSPTGEHLLLKSRHVDDFQIFVMDKASKQIIASDRSSDTQLSLTWRPDGKAIAFQESRGGNRHYSLFLFELNSGKRRRLNAPPTGSAALPLRWSPTGGRLAYFQTSEKREANIQVLDMKNERSPAVVLDSIAFDGDFGWSPDGQQIAAVSAADNGEIVVANLESSDRKSLVVSAGGKIRHLAWAPDGKRLVVSARVPGGEFFQVFELELQQSRLTQRTTHNGDVSSPLWLRSGESFIYHLNHDANRLAYLNFRDGSSGRVLGFTSGVNQVQTLTPDGKGAFVLTKPTVGLPFLSEIDLASGGSTLLYPASSGIVASAISPAVVHIKSKDDRAIPALLWQSARSGSATNFVLIEVHGGPRIQSTPEWDAGKQFLLAKGIHVLSIDYRGSSGHGVAYEEMTDQIGQVDDVIAACDYAVNVLKAPRGGVVLLGSSYGSTLVLGASVKKSEILAGIILVSVLSAPTEPNEPRSNNFRVVGFHGKNDPLLSPSRARFSIEGYLGSRSLAPPRGHWEVFPGEGHDFHRTLSWTKIYTAILDTFFGRTNAQ